ncbi:hypothetical protein Q5O24_12200 [Eubacteriaceae bacterium ES3]|nr:hypothetical protein Q5O24_12200 [Eubacteriaceae bacterium ES3]
MINQLKSENGYSIYELLVVLVILTGAVVFLTAGSSGLQKGMEKRVFNQECEDVYYLILESQNQAMMDNAPRKLSFLSSGVYLVFTKDRIVHSQLIKTDHINFSGNFFGAQSLTLYAAGTVSKGGKIIMTNRKYSDLTREITIQVANGRIYINE